eukprot:3702595-Pleurochrysis_carterae.AAC.1
MAASLRGVAYAEDVPNRGQGLIDRLILELHRLSGGIGAFTSIERRVAAQARAPRRWARRAGRWCSGRRAGLQITFDGNDELGEDFSDLVRLSEA